LSWSVVRNLLALVGASALAWSFLKFVDAMWWSALCPGGCNFDGGVAGRVMIAAMDMPPVMVVYAGAATLLCLALRSAHYAAWVLMLGAIGALMHNATTLWGGDAGTVAFFVLDLASPILGALLGWLAWRGVERRKASVAAITP
jgi:hypothetical protein